MKKNKIYLEPGEYSVEATIRGRYIVETKDKKTEDNLVDELMVDNGAELVDWDVF